MKECIRYIGTIADILIQLVEKSDVIRKERIKYEEEQCRREEKKRQWEQHIKMHNLEVEKLTALLREAQQKDIQNKKTDWISWAKEKADWYDPTVDKCDKMFGKRDHEDDPIPHKEREGYW